MRDCTVEQNKAECNCTYEPCSRKGVCCQCVSYHRRLGELAACFFVEYVERTYDRTIEAFVKSYQRREQ